MAQNENNQELLNELNRLKKKASTMTLIAVVFFILTFAVGVIKGGPAVLPCFLGIMIFAILAGINTNKYNKYYKENVVKNMTLDECDFLDDLTFDPDLGISKDEVYSLNVIRGDRFSSNDLITAKYKNVGFRQSDVHMADIHVDKDGHQHETTIFQGRWMVFDFNKDFNWNLQVMSKNFHTANKLGGLFGFGGKKTSKILFENETFNKQFTVYAEDEQEAFYILTPHMMESIIGLKASLNAPIMLVFSGGVLHVAVYNNQDAFEGKLFGQINLEEEKAKVLSDIKLITDFVDELALERDIYKI